MWCLLTWVLLWQLAQTQTTLNSDAYEPLYIQLDTGIVKGVLSCPDFILDNLHFGNVIMKLAGVVPSICPFKYDPPSLIGYQLLANESITPRVKCDTSFQELMNANGYWREMGVKLHVDLRVCGGLDVKGTDFANCDPRDEKFWHVNTTLTLEREVACFTMALKSRGKDKVYHENGKEYIMSQDMCYGTFSHSQGLQVSVGNVDSIVGTSPTFLSSILSGKRSNKASDLTFLTNRAHRVHEPTLSPMIQIPLKILYSKAHLKQMSKMLNQFVKSQVDDANRADKTLKLEYPAKTRLAQCFMVMSDLHTNKLVNMSEVVDTNIEMTRLLGLANEDQSKRDVEQSHVDSDYVIDPKTGRVETKLYPQKSSKDNPDPRFKRSRQVKKKKAVLLDEHDEDLLLQAAESYTNTQLAARKRVTKADKEKERRKPQSQPEANDALDRYNPYVSELTNDVDEVKDAKQEHPFSSEIDPWFQEEEYNASPEHTRSTLEQEDLVVTSIPIWDEQGFWSFGGGLPTPLHEWLAIPEEDAPNAATPKTELGVQGVLSTNEMVIETPSQLTQDHVVSEVVRTPIVGNSLPVAEPTRTASLPVSEPTRTVSPPPEKVPFEPTDEWREQHKKRMENFLNQGKPLNPVKSPKTRDNAPVKPKTRDNAPVKPVTPNAKIQSSPKSANDPSLKLPDVEIDLDTERLLQRLEQAAQRLKESMKKKEKASEPIIQTPGVE